MTRSSEARLWQAVGVPIGLSGGLLLAYTFGRYGLASLDHRALQNGIASSFIILAGGASFFAGRALHVEQTHLTPLESRLWIVLATVCLVGGTTIEVFAKTQHFDSIVDQLATGMAGASFLLFGVLCLLGQRVMSRMHDAWVLTAADRERIEQEEKARAKRAYLFFGDEN